MELSCVFVLRQIYLLVVLIWQSECGEIMWNANLMHMCVCVCVYIYIYIYIYREREREREFWNFDRTVKRKNFKIRIEQF